MTTIREEIAAWAARNVQGATAITRDEGAYNHMQAAVQELLNAPWANLEVKADMAGQVGAQGASSTIKDAGGGLST